jgi:hypothetical protein
MPKTTGKKLSTKYFCDKIDKKLIKMSGVGLRISRNAF